jgi:hypothetical protein
MNANPSRQRNPTRGEVREALQDADFPLTKQALVACVDDQGGAAGLAVARQLQALPLATYESLDEVLRSVDLADQRGY